MEDYTPRSATPSEREGVQENTSNGSLPVTSPLKALKQYETRIAKAEALVRSRYEDVCLTLGVSMATEIKEKVETDVNAYTGDERPIVRKLAQAIQELKEASEERENFEKKNFEGDMKTNTIQIMELRDRMNTIQTEVEELREAVDEQSGLMEGMMNMFTDFCTKISLYLPPKVGQLGLYKGHKNAPCSIAVFPGTDIVVSGTGFQEDDRIPDEVNIWRASTQETLKSISGTRVAVYSVQVFPTGKLFITGGDDKLIRVWATETGECIRVIEGHTDSVFSLAVFPDGKHFLSTSADHSVKVGNVICREIIVSTVSPQIWNTETCECRFTLARSDGGVGHSGMVFASAMLPDGSGFVTGSADNSVILWETDKLFAGEKTCKKVLTGHSDWVQCIAAWPDSTRVVSGSSDKTLKVSLPAWNDNSTTILSCAQPHQVWDTASLECVATLRGHTGIVYSVAVFDSGHRLLSGSDDKSIRMWSTQDFTCLQVLTIPTACTSIAILPPSPDMTPGVSRFVSRYGPRSMKVWEVVTLPIPALKY